MSRAKGVDVPAKQRSVEDYSADYQVPDVIPVPRLPKENSRGSVAGGNTGAPRWHKKPRPKSNSSAGSAAQQGDGAVDAAAAAAAAAKAPISELDPHRLAQRQKQIDYGKNTLGYQRYLEQVPKNKRRKKGEIWLDPVTPDIHQEISKRCFDGQVKVWRRALHKYDLQEEDDKVEPLSYAERERVQAMLGDSVALSAAPSSPTNSSRSRGSLDGYLEPLASEGGRKRPFKRAFDNSGGGESYPSKLLTSPAGPRPAAPQSAPPATAADTDRAPPPVGRCVDPPTAPPRTGAIPRSASALNAAAPPAPQTAPPAPAARGVTAGSTALMSPRRPTRGSASAADELRSPRELAGADELFREWDDEDYAGLEAYDDAELEDVQL